MAASQDLLDELEALRSENKQLTEDLTQCQADKEFVWSLWKRLQVANPDITQAISLVVQREKEKAEVKDRKVLEILQIKDDKIEQLKGALTAREQETASLSQRRQDYQTTVSRLEEDNRDLKERLVLLGEQLKSRENREKSLEQLQRQVIENQEKDRADFEKEAANLQSELKKVMSEKNDLLATRIQQDSKIALLEQNVKAAEMKVTDYDATVARFEKDVKKYAEEAAKHKQEIEEKNRELESVRKELSELWQGHQQCGDHAAEQASLLRQLKRLQEDTEKIVSNQEAAYKIETGSLQTMYEELKGQYSQLKQVEGTQRQQLSELKQQLSTRDEMLAELELRLESALRETESSPRSSTLRDAASFREVALSPVYKQVSDGDGSSPRVVAGLEKNVANLKKEVNFLRMKLKDRNRVISQLDRHHSLDDLDLSHIPTNHQTRRHSRCKSAPSVVKPSGSPDLQKRLSVMEQKLETTKDLLDLKNAELKTLQGAHERRLARLRALQADYRLVREQLKVAEEELHGPKPKRKRIPRATPKDLQKEQNFEALWNELTHFKSESKNLAVEKMNLEEELDSLRVRESQDAATIHELKLCLEQEKEELQYLLTNLEEKDRERTSKEFLQQENDKLNMKIKDQLHSIQQLEDKVTQLEGENERLHDDRRSLRSEVNNLKQVESHKRIELADLKAEVTRLQKRLHRQQLVISRNQSNNHRRVKSVSPKKSTPLVKKSLSTPVSCVEQPRYKRKLNRSIEQMSAIFDEFDNKDWEELSASTSDRDSGDSDIDSTNSLGERIVKTAVYRQPVTSSPKKVEPPIGDSSPISDIDSGSDYKKVAGKRDIATSPIRVNPGRVQKKRTVYTANHSSGQLGPLKQRLGSLQAQVTALRTDRSNLSKNTAELQQQNDQLQTELAATNQRAKMNKQTIQKLTSDLERLQCEKDDLERQLAMKVHVPEREHDIRNTQDWQRMEQRLKASQAEVSRQSSVNRNLREENMAFEEQISSMREKINRLERDISQKRILLDDFRLKLKLSHESARTEIINMGDLEGKVRSLTEVSDRLKTQNKSLETRLQVVSKEKKEYEESYYKVSSDLEKKTKLLAECQLKKTELEGALADVERTAKDQLQHLAGQSEAAVEAAQTKLQESHSLIQELHSFVKTLSVEILRGVQNARMLIRQQKNRARSESRRKAQREMERAQDVARNILNIGQTELDELMEEEELEKETMENDLARHKDRKWSKKWERLLATKHDFAVPLVEVMMEKVEERVQLLSRLRT